MNMNEILTIAFMMLFVPVLGLFFMGLERKITARIHNRIGPPVYQQFVDVMKLFSKRENISHSWVFDIGPIFAVVGVLATMLFIPMGGFPMLSFHGDLIVIMYLMVISGLGMALGAGASGNPNAGIGVMRSLVLMMAYELPFVLTLLSVMLYYNTTSLGEIVAKQGETGWGILALPLSALVADLCLQGQFGEKPFDQPVAPHEVATGPMVEYGGKHLGMLFLWHAIAVVMEGSLFVSLFLGGAIFFDPSTITGMVLNLLLWIVLVFMMFFIAILINGVMLRFRIGQAFAFYWKWPTVLAIIALAYVMVVSAW